MGTDASVDVNRFLFFLDFLPVFLFLKSGVYETCERLFVLVRDLLRLYFSSILGRLTFSLLIRSDSARSRRTGSQAATRSDETF